MPTNRELLALELQQIILADRMAADVISSAEDTKKHIEQKTEKEKQAILQAVKAQKDELAQRAKQEQAHALDTRKKQLGAQFAQKRGALQDTMDQNKEAWTSEIVGRITAP